MGPDLTPPPRPRHTRRVQFLLPSTSPDELARLAAAAPGVTLITYENEADAVAKAGEAEGFLGVPFPELLPAAPRLRWVQIRSAGVEHYLFPELVASDITVTNAKVIYGTHLADHLMAFILAFNRNLPHLFRCQQR